MIRRILESLEAAGASQMLAGLDSQGSVAWRRSATDLLLAIGAWQSLLRERGARAGDRVALDVPRGPQLLPAHLAALALGATVVPINPALSSAERQRILERAEVATLLDADAQPGAPGAPALAARDPGLPALLIFTSGTTGQPKGVPLTESNLEANLRDLTEVWGLTGGEPLLHALPAHHVHGLVLALYGSVRCSMPVVMMERFDADVCLRALSEQAIRVFMGVPTMYHRMNRSALDVDLPEVRLFVSGSAPLAASDHEAFARRVGQAPLERYGLSETLIVASNPLDRERRPGAVGFPLPHAEVRLAADAEIEVRGPAVMKGYWRAPESNADSFRDGFFRTGDLGELDDDGYLRIFGRKKELIIVGGSNVLPGEVEVAFAGAPGVEELAAAGVPDPDRGEVVALFVVAAAGESEARLESRLRERAEADLAPYKRPRIYRFVRALPRNAMGKIDRRSLSRNAADV